LGGKLHFLKSMPAALPMELSQPVDSRSVATTRTALDDAQ